MKTVIFLAVLSLLQYEGGAVSIEQPTSDFTQQRALPGDPVSLACTFRYENNESPLRNPVTWRKCQNQTEGMSPRYTEYRDNSVQVANLESVMGVFHENDRITAVINQATGDDRLTYTLTISEVQARDSGYYRCQAEVQGEDPIHRTIDLSVLNTIQSVDMYAQTKIIDTDGAEEALNTNNSNTVILVQGKNSHFECQSRGGFPSPTLKLFVGDKQRTEYLQQTTESVTFTGDVSNYFGVPSANKIIYSDKFQLTKEDHGKTIKCEGTNSEDDSNKKYKEKMLTIFYKATFGSGCRAEFTMPLDEPLVLLTCTVSARPTPTSITWSALKTGASLLSNSEIREPNLNIEASHMLGADDSVEATLSFHNVNYEQFQDYQLMVNNRVGESIFNIKVSEGALVGEVGGSNSIKAASLLIALTSILLLLLF